MARLLPTPEGVPVIYIVSIRGGIALLALPLLAAVAAISACTTDRPIPPWYTAPSDVSNDRTIVCTRSRSTPTPLSSCTALIVVTQYDFVVSHVALSQHSPADKRIPCLAAGSVSSLSSVGVRSPPHAYSMCVANTFLSHITGLWQITNTTSLPLLLSKRTRMWCTVLTSTCMEGKEKNVNGRNFRALVPTRPPPVHMLGVPSHPAAPLLRARTHAIEHPSPLSSPLLSTDSCAT